MRDPGGYIGEAMRECGSVAPPYSVSVIVPGAAKGQPRPRAFSRNGKARMYDPGTAEGWKSAIAAAFAGKLPSAPLEGRVAVDIVALFARPKSHLGKGGKVKPSAPLDHCHKPDVDNLAKAVLDCLTTIGMWRDDAQVRSLTVNRYWSMNGVSETRIDVTA